MYPNQVKKSTLNNEKGSFTKQAILSISQEIQTSINQKCKKTGDLLTKSPVIVLTAL